MMWMYLSDNQCITMIMDYVLILPEQRLMSFLTFLFRDLSDTSQEKTFPVFHSVWLTRSWLVTATRPSAATLMSVVGGVLCWDSGSHLIWGLKPHPEHTSVCCPDSSPGTRRSSTDGSTEWHMNQSITESITDSWSVIQHQISCH